ncbi:Glycoside hydrolase, 10 [Turnera subulata]|uniref:Glycoside hydrolase, 10 n=1 Tax=Turnera subulata TaxID=218843 RepID=A0A9Q0JAS4_9ROSI|nr:Glycoside hydrolase, 10 [Turnera subulata]
MGLKTGLPKAARLSYTNQWMMAKYCQKQAASSLRLQQTAHKPGVGLSRSSPEECMQPGIPYEVTGLVRIYGGSVTSATVQLTLWVQEEDLREEYIAIASLLATDKDRVQLQGEFLLNGSPSRAVIFIEGPPPGTDILVNGLDAKHAPKTPPSARPVPKDAPFGVNIIENSNLEDDTFAWFPLGDCALSVGFGSPHELPPMARDSLGPHEPLSGRYLLATHRTESWMGPAQMVTVKLKPYLTYQVSAWVRIGPGATGPQIVNVALGIDGQWFNGGEIECSGDEKWHEIGGSIRIEKRPSNAMVYVQGPASGVDLMVAGLQIFAVDRKARFKYLKQRTDKIADSIASSLGMQNKHGHNQKFVRFLVDNFRWVVFANELKWSWTEPQQGVFNYREADQLLDLCERYNLQVRGHCIFWEKEDAIPSWVQSLNATGLMAAVQNHLSDLLTRYKGKFRHYDVDNEMLHGSFFIDRLGKGIQANMFKTAHQLDPSAILFVNDYHIGDGSDSRSTPEKYVQQILDLQEQGAPVGGIGVQGHIDVPVGPIVSSALDKLGTLGIPIWFTELEVASDNEYVRADDLEVMLREAFAHPSVEGVVLWGFWELYMFRRNAHLVNADGKINAAGKRFLALKKEWLSNAYGSIDVLREFRFRGFHGTYNVEIVSSSKQVNKTFVVEQGETPLVVSIDL